MIEELMNRFDKVKEDMAKVEGLPEYYFRVAHELCSVEEIEIARKMQPSDSAWGKGAYPVVDFYLRCNDHHVSSRQSTRTAD